MTWSMLQRCSEFPIVLLSGINSRPTIGGSALFDRSDGRVEVGVGPASSRFATGGYEDLLKREQDQAYAERVRLMYVAATRARDHLTVSLRRQPMPNSGNGTLAHVISKAMESAPGLWEAALLGGPEALATHPVPQDVAPLDHSLEARDASGGEYPIIPCWNSAGSVFCCCYRSRPFRRREKRSRRQPSRAQGSRRQPAWGGRSTP